MGYFKAQNVLPEEIVKLIHNYIDGEYVYIPRKSGNEKYWGEKNGTRTCLREKNNEIFLRYTTGTDFEELVSNIFYLKKV